MHAVLLSSLLCAIAAGAPPAEPLWVQLGPQNVEHGLSVPSAGDGINTPETIAGSPCRRIARDKSHYLYVKIDDRLVPAGEYDAYLAIEFYDDRVTVIRVQYDKVPSPADANSRYAHAEDLCLGLDTRRWRRSVIRLNPARFGSGQNHQADLRVHADGLAVRRIELTFAPPADYRPGGMDRESLELFRTHIESGVELTFGSDADRGQAALMRALGVTSVESYVTWQTVEDAGQGRWDWSRWDRQVEVLREAGLKWVPFLIAGPGYATPKWYRESDQSVPYVCLEHSQAGKIQSLWNPRLRPWIERFLKAFADRYRDSGIVESVLLGVSGTYGETLYPAGPADGWTYVIPGPFHNHRGWWAGDPLAAESFRNYLGQRYARIDALNQAWSSSYADLQAIRPMLPEKAPSLRARSDMVEWYLDSMTEFATFWVAATRKLFPNTPIYLCVGGSGDRTIGADFAAQARAIAPYGARIRITNEASNYALNFSITREVATAARAYGLDFGFEPAGHVNAYGNVARIYNATASGAKQLFCYTNNVFAEPGGLTAFRQHASFIARRTPIVYAAVYLPKTSWALEPSSQAQGFAAARDLRDRTDLEFLDRLTIHTPLAREVRVLAIPDAPYAEAKEIEALRHWVEQGGILLARCQPGRPWLRTPEGSDELRRSLFAEPADGQPAKRSLGRGATLALRCATPAEFNSAVVEALLHPDRLVAGARGVALPSPEVDLVYATELTDGWLYLNANSQPRTVAGQEISAGGILWRAKP